MLVTANLDRIAEFKASRSGIEAKTREIVARAETAVSELQLLAAQVAGLSLSLVKRQGRIGGYSDEEQDAIRTSIFGVLGKLGLSDETTKQVLRDWHRVVEFDHAHYILEASHIPHTAPAGILEELKALRANGVASYASAQELRAFLSRSGYLSSEIEPLLQDYEYYSRNRTFRRPEAWRDRANWRHLKKT